MAKFFVLNQVRVGTIVLLPGTEIDERVVDKTAVVNCGGILLDSSPSATRAAVAKILALGLSIGETTDQLINFRDSTIAAVALNDGGAVVLPDVDNTVLTFADGAWRNTPNTIGGPRTYLIDPTGGTSNLSKMRISVKTPLASSVTIANAGPAGGNLYTFPANTIGEAIFFLEGADMVLEPASWQASSQQIPNTLMLQDASSNAACAQLTTRDLLFPADEASPTISQATSTLGAGVDLVVTTQPGLAGAKSGDFVLNGGPASGADSGAYCLQIGGITVARRRYDGSIPETTDSIATSIFSLRGASLFTVGTSARFITNSVELDGQLTSASFALGTSGAVAWDTNNGHNAHCLATGNVTALTMTNSGDGGRYELEFVPSGSHFTLTLSGIVFPTTTYSQAGLTTLCGSATRIVLIIKNKRGVLYLENYTGYSS